MPPGTWLQLLELSCPLPRRRVRSAACAKRGDDSTLGVGKTGPDPAQAVALPADAAVRVPLGTPMPTGATASSLLYNEYIVYDPAQVRQRFALTVKFRFNDDE